MKISNYATIDDIIAEKFWWGLPIMSLHKPFRYLAALLIIIFTIPFIISVLICKLIKR